MTQSEIKSHNSPGKKIRRRSQFVEVWRRFCKNRLAMVGLFLLIIFILIAVFADVLFDYDAVVVKQNVKERLQGPSAGHWFGTDELGRDILARIVHGSRISLVVGIIAVGLAVLVGCPLGAIAGYYGGKLDNAIMRVMDICLSLPQMLLAITIVAALGSSILNLMIAIGISTMPQFARVTRSAVISVKNSDYIEAARVIGANDKTIILKHIIPNALAPILVHATLRVGLTIIATASLSFIGLGVQAPRPEWGAMLAGGRSFLRDAIHICLFPGMAIFLTVLALNFVGDGLRDSLDPRLKK
jgi:peptide/nickel transport system permease protein